MFADMNPIARYIGVFCLLLLLACPVLALAGTGLAFTSFSVAALTLSGVYFAL